MRSAMLVLLAVALGVNGQCFGAQDATRRALAEELLNEMQIKENLEKSFAMMKKMIPQFSKMEQATKNSASSDETKAAEGEKEEKAAKAGAKMFDALAKEMTWDNMKDDYITIYAETYTEEELKGLIDFYKTPIGRAFMKKQPELMKRSMEMTQKRMVQWMPKIQALSKEMMESSHKKAEKAVPPAKEPPAPPVVQPPQSRP